MKVRTINAMIKDGEECGRYVYAKTATSIVTGSWPRIIKSRSNRGIIQVKELTSGSWSDLVDNGITMR